MGLNPIKRQDAFNKLLKRSEKMTAINTAEEIELVYLWQDPATSRMFFTTHMVPNQLLSRPESSATGPNTDALPVQEQKEEIKGQQEEVKLPQIMIESVPIKAEKPPTYFSPYTTSRLEKQRKYQNNIVRSKGRRPDGLRINNQVLAEITDGNIRLRRAVFRLFKALMVRGIPATKTILFDNGKLLSLKERLAQIFGEEYVIWLSKILDEVKAPKPGERQDVVLKKHHDATKLCSDDQKRMLTLLNLCYFYHRSHLEAFITDQKLMLAFKEAIPYLEAIGTKEYFGYKSNRSGSGKTVSRNSVRTRTRTFKEEVDSIMEIHQKLNF